MWKMKLQLAYGVLEQSNNPRDDKNRCEKMLKIEPESNDWWKFQDQFANMVDVTWVRISFLTCINFGWEKNGLSVQRPLPGTIQWSIIKSLPVCLGCFSLPNLKEPQQFYCSLKLIFLLLFLFSSLQTIFRAAKVPVVQPGPCLSSKRFTKKHTPLLYSR